MAVGVAPLLMRLSTVLVVSPAAKINQSINDELCALANMM